MNTNTISNGGKRILKDIVHDYIPKELVDRPKAGFSLPIYKWLIGDLRYLIDEYLSEKSISESDLFNASFVTRQVDLFKKDRFYYKPIIWKLINVSNVVFQMDEVNCLSLILTKYESVNSYCYGWIFNG